MKNTQIGIFIIGLLILSCSPNRGFYIEDIGGDVKDEILCLDSNYRNNLIVSDEVGTIFLQDSLTELKILVSINWSNKYVSVGVMTENLSPQGRWLVYDENSRIRRYMRFDASGKIILSYSEFNKHGKLVRKGEASVPW
jgi:hypothetical protein